MCSDTGLSVMRDSQGLSASGTIIVSSPLRMSERCVKPPTAYFSLASAAVGAAVARPVDPYADPAPRAREQQLGLVGCVNSVTAALQGVGYPFDAPGCSMRVAYGRLRSEKGPCLRQSGSSAPLRSSWGGLNAE